MNSAELKSMIPPLTEIEGGTRITPAIRAYALFFSYLGRMMARPPK